MSMVRDDERVAGERQVLDMRLVPAAVGCWVATIVAVSVGWVAGVVLAVGAVVVALGLWVVVLWAIAHERERWRVVAVAGLATMVLTAGFAAAGAWREHHVRAHPLRESVGKSVTVLAAVTDDPKPMRAGGFGGQRRWIVHAGLHEFGSRTATTRAGGTIVVLASGDAWADLAPGQVIRFRARVSEPHRADLTVATLNALADPARHGQPPWWQRVAAGIRADLVGAAARALPPDAAGLLPALVVGDTTALSDAVRDSFETAGLQHLCVVSGANFTILLMALLALTRLLTAGPRVSAAAAAGVVVVFIVLARPDPSVLRAAAMGSVTVLALLTGRRKQALPALGAAVIGLLVVAPGLAVSAGFALSVLATAGLILLAPSWADWLRARGWWRAPAEIVAVSAGAFVVTLPLMVGLSGRVSLVAIVANALVAPVVGVITVIGAVGAVVACLWHDAAVPVLWCARPPLWWLLSVADRMAAIPGASLSVPSGLAAGLVATAVVVVVVAALRWSKTRRLLAVGVLGVAIVLVPVRLWHPGWPPDGWVLAMCDVGQGDGLALSVGPGAAVVIDTGPDPRSIRRCLDRLRITRISLLVLTHPHADHIDGLAGALRGRTIDAIATAPGELSTSGGTPPCLPNPTASAPSHPTPSPPPTSDTAHPRPTTEQTAPIAPKFAGTTATVPHPATARLPITQAQGLPEHHALTEDNALAEDSAPTEAHAPAEGNAPTEAHAPTEGNASTEDKAASKDNAPTEGNAATEANPPTEDFASSEGDAPTEDPVSSEDHIPAEGLAPSEDHTPTDDHAPTQPGVVPPGPAGPPAPTDDHAPTRPGVVPPRIAGPSAPAVDTATRVVSAGLTDPVSYAGETRTEVRRDVCPGGAENGRESGFESETARHRHGHGEETGGIERVVDLAESERISLIELHDGLELHFGAVRVEVLAPGRDAPPSFALDGANDRSLVLRAQTAVGTILFTGDIEEAAQTRLLGQDLRADILKIPHHGSRTTTPAFLRAVHPRLALISAGADNTFGHPHPAVTTALDALGATVARTDRHGDVIVFGTATDLRTVTARR
ncbi:ComEC/Rec2 family competence protein [Nocardia neocaledoniensis]|uniref:ComEC/Rec2 family competence protein n=1 Tax=Nocardia neocaledoniensis TaxID=236511 RepID=UPI002456EC7B|nr:ComEC/Rec2 family competence protein [Nocardia neocaledoniensis]